jgi:sortase A
MLATTLATVGVVLLAETAVTLLWQEPLSHAYTAWQQAKLSDRLDEVEASLRGLPSPRTHGAGSAPELPFSERAEALAENTKAEDPLGRLRIPSLDVEQVLVEGVGSGSLTRGPGHYEDTSLPGEDGTVGIAGHRTTYSAPFRNIDKLGQGQTILLKMPYGRFAYRVTDSAVVPPDDVSVLAPAHHARLVLTSCNPVFSDAERIVVYARLTKASPKSGGEMASRSGARRSDAARRWALVG